MRVLALFVLISFFMCSTITLNAKDLEHDKVHTHGVGTLLVTITKDTIQSVLKVPSKDMVGFEGFATTRAQKNAAKSIQTLMTTEYNLYLTDDAAECVPSKRSLDQDFKAHGDYTFKMDYTCKNISKLKALDVNVFRDIESLNELNVQLRSLETKKNLKLNRTENKIDLGVN